MLASALHRARTYLLTLDLRYKWMAAHDEHQHQHSTIDQFHGGRFDLFLRSVFAACPYSLSFLVFSLHDEVVRPE